MNNLKISFDVHCTDLSLPLNFEAWLDDHCFFRSAVSHTQHVAHEFELTESTHILQFKLLGKTQAHTTIDAQGNIVKDAMICVENLEFDDLSVQPLLTSISEYCHDHNGNSDPVQDKFFNHMGCNGTVKIEFYMPIYMWFLENL